MERLAVMTRRELDEEVIEACRRGDSDAFRLLFETYKDRVYSIALHYTSDDALARDVTQHVFVKLMTRIDQYRSDAAFSTWLYRLVANACLDERRKSKRLSQLDEETPLPVLVDDAPSGEQRLLERELSDQVRTAVASLQPSLRITVLLRYFEELSYEEMAEALGVSKGTVASRLSRGHQLLARKLAHLKSAVAGGGRC